MGDAIKTIAEVGINHNGDLDIAKRLIDLAILAGFDYVKLQKRTPALCVPEEKKNEIKQTPWGEMTYLDYKYRLEFSTDDYFYLNAYCSDRIGFFASVWDLDAAQFMKNFTDIVKIPSALIVDDALIMYCRKHYKTVIMSTGMSTENEIDKAVALGNPDVILHTNSTYPSPSAELRLNYIKWLRYKYPDKQVGYSGHEWGLTTTYAAAAMGATWIERHITLDHDMWGTDQKASVDPVGCIKLVRGIKAIEVAMGTCGPRVVTAGELAKAKDLRK